MTSASKSSSVESAGQPGNRDAADASKSPSKTDLRPRGPTGKAIVEPPRGPERLSGRAEVALVEKVADTDVRIERQRDVPALAPKDMTHLRPVRVRDGHERRPVPRAARLAARSAGGSPPDSDSVHS